MINYCGIHKVSTNQNFGYSTRLPYDQSTYNDKLYESVGPLKYRLNTNYVYNCDACLSTLGPRSGTMGFGVSMPIDNEPAVAQAPALVNIESILTNRNVYASRNRRNEVNPIDVTKFKLKNPRVCNDFLNPLSSRLSYPPANYRDMGINRFYDLNKNPQKNIFYDFAVNTTLTAKDNYVTPVPRIWSARVSLPDEVKGRTTCQSINACPMNGKY